MNADDERWLRTGLATAVPEVQAPPDLVARAERTAAGIRRRRVAVAAAVVVLLLAIPFTVAGLRYQALPPAGSTDPACQPPTLVLPRQPYAVNSGDAEAWGYRGDPALRPVLERWLERSDLQTEPLYARRLDEPAGSALYVWASQRSPADVNWTVGAAVMPAVNPGDLDFGTPYEVTMLPQRTPNAAISMLLDVPYTTGSPVRLTGWDRTGNLLVVLGPPGTTRISYHGCYRGTVFEVAGDGDALVRAIGPVDATGRLNLSNGSVPGYAGRAADLPVVGFPPGVEMPAVKPIDVPRGKRELFRGRSQGALPPLTAKPGFGRNVTVLMRCRGPAPMEIDLTLRVLGPVPCDEKVHTAGEGVDLSAQFDPRVVTGLRGDQLRPRQAYEVVVVTDR